nr:MAG TPA: hypothetical protein [Caudoviricetes sp.]
MWYNGLAGGSPLAMTKNFSSASAPSALPPVVRRLTNMRPAYNCPLPIGDL